MRRSQIIIYMAGFIIATLWALYVAIYAPSANVRVAGVFLAAIGGMNLGFVLEKIKQSKKNRWLPPK